MDLGPWAVEQALSVGIFSYVLKLLQTTGSELRRELVFIWSKILALDRACQDDLVKDGHAHILYFLRHVRDSEVADLEKAMAAFVLAIICERHPRGQALCLEHELLETCLEALGTGGGKARAPFMRLVN